MRKKIKFNTTISRFLIMIAVFVILTTLSTFFFKYQLEPFAVRSNLNELERGSLSFTKILFNNIIVCIFAITGLFLIRIPAIVVFLINPMVLGFILAANWVSTGEIFYFIKMLIPHSIFEIPAIVLSCSIGIKGKAALAKLKEGKLSIDLVTIIILLIIAATVESTISASLFYEL